MAKQQRNYHWDKRKRRYVQLQPGEQVMAGKRMRTESGASVRGKGEASGLYKKWSKAHQTRIMPVGQQEDDKAPSVAGMEDRCIASTAFIVDAFSGLIGSWHGGGVTRKHSAVSPSSLCVH